MSSVQDTSNVTQTTETQKNDKEYNFAQLRRQLEAERQARLEIERKAQELEQKIAFRADQRDGEEEDSDELYVDEKRLNKKLASFERNIEKKIEEKAEMKARYLLEQEKQSAYLRENADFNTTMSAENVEKFAQRHPRLAENILRMPEGFERQKLVYENIKALGIDKPEARAPSIQEKIDANRRSPYYQPSGVGTSPYSNGGDFSPAGQKNAYEKMKELKSRLRLG